MSDDEDGARVDINRHPSGKLWACTPGRLEFDVEGPGFLNVWADYARDLDWSGSYEHVVIDQAFESGRHTIDLFVPCHAEGLTNFRWRYSSVEGISFDGLAPDGEVEDHQWEIIPYTFSECPSKSAADEVVIMVPGIRGLLGGGAATCQQLFGRVTQDFMNWGWDPQSLITVALYDDQLDCSYRLHDYPSSAPTQSLTMDTSIREVAWRLAWLIHEEFTGSRSDPANPELLDPNRPDVDVLTYSLGGLLIRYAMTASDYERRFTQDPDPQQFPLMDIEDVFTAGAPHGGFGSIGQLATLACTPPIQRQCREMIRNEPLMTFLNGRGYSNGRNPPVLTARSGQSPWVPRISLAGLAVGWE